MTDNLYSQIGVLEIDTDTSMTLTIPELDLLAKDPIIKEALGIAKSLVLETIQDVLQEHFALDPRLYGQTIENIEIDKEKRDKQPYKTLQSG